MGEFFTLKKIFPRIYSNGLKAYGTKKSTRLVCASMTTIEALHIMPGLLCNFKCSHCVNDSGPTRTEIVSEDEILKISAEIKTYSPKKIIFTGGEPTLHLDIINRLISAHPNLEDAEIFITTNGWFSKSENSIGSVLNKFLKINHLQLSFDTFHGSRLTVADIKRLRDNLRTKNVNFNISMCISNPLDLFAAHKLQQNIEELVIFQKVDATGRAKSNNLHFKYPTFEKESLAKKCPNFGQISYIVNKGFSVCCSNLIFNNETSQEIYHQSIAEHVNSEFYSNLKNKTFGEILKERSIDTENLSYEYSSPCRLCELAHRDN